MKFAWGCDFSDGTMSMSKTHTKKFPPALNAAIGPCISQAYLKDIFDVLNILNFARPGRS